MNWIVLALIAPAVYTIVNYIDKYIIEKKVKDYRGMPIYGALTGLVVGTIFWFSFGHPILGLRDSLLIVSSGIISLFAYYLYFSALSRSHTSYVIILLQMSPIFTLILAIIFLKEIITIKQMVGFVLVLSAAIALSLESKLERFRLSTSFYLIICATIFLSIASILIKFTINANSFIKIFSYESWGLALGGLMLFVFYPNARKAFGESFRSVGNKALGIMFLNEIVFVIAKAIQFLAIALGPVALVSVLGSTMALYGILYGAILTLLLPRIFKEDITKGGLLKKVIFSVVLLLGIYFIGLS